MTEINLKVLQLINENKSLKEIASTLNLTEKQLFVRIKQIINYTTTTGNLKHFQA